MSEDNRAAPTTTSELKVRFALQAHILTAIAARRDAWDALAWSHNRSSLEYEQAMCSEWNVGNLVMRANDWKPGTGKRPGKAAFGDENPVQGMAVCTRSTLDALRVSFAEMKRQPHVANRNEVHLNNSYQAYTRAYNDVARHIASGKILKPLEPAGQEGQIGWAPGSDPLLCPVEGCTASAFLFEATRGEGTAMEAVCRADATHRWNPLNSKILHKASLAMRPACPYCYGRDTVAGEPFKTGETVLFPYYCNNCEPYFLLTFPYNPPQRMVWIKNGTERDNITQMLTRNGLPQLDANRPMPSPYQRQRASAIALELERIKQLMADTDTTSILGIRGPTLTEGNLMLRFRMWEDLNRSFFRGAQFYIDYAVGYLGHELNEAKFSVTYQIFFFRKHGFDHVIDRVMEDRSEERVFVQELLEKDLRKGFVRDRDEYLSEIRKKFPAYSGKGPEILYSRVLDVFRKGRYGKIVAKKVNPRTAEKAFLWECMEKDAKSGPLRTQAAYEKDLREAFPHYNGRGPQALTHKTFKRFVRSHRTTRGPSSSK